MKAGLVILHSPYSIAAMKCSVYFRFYGRGEESPKILNSRAHKLREALSETEMISFPNVHILSLMQDCTERTKFTFNMLFGIITWIIQKSVQFSQFKISIIHFQCLKYTWFKFKYILVLLFSDLHDLKPINYRHSTFTIMISR